MAYYVDLFSPDTYTAFMDSARTLSGFRESQRRAASRIRPGDTLIAYVTKVSRWVGLLVVEDGPFEDATPVFRDPDPFIVRFHVQPRLWLPVEEGIPIRDPALWHTLSFTRGQDPATATWTGKLRASLTPIDPQDAEHLVTVLEEQARSRRAYPLTDQEQRRWRSRPVPGAGRDVIITIPDNEERGPEPLDEAPRESSRIQALLAHVGTRMGYQIWVPPADRDRVIAASGGRTLELLTRLPLNYDTDTLRTIEQIDVLWLRRRFIQRAFEVEHTTAVYSGILRMADLMALQPNLDIKLHIVAPAARRVKVFAELRRPAFAHYERGPMYERCTFLAYDSVEALAGQPWLEHLQESVVDEFAEHAEDAEE